MRESWFLRRLDLLFDFACLSASVIHNLRVFFDLFQERYETFGVRDPVGSKFVFDLLEPLRDAETFKLNRIRDVEAERLLIDQRFKEVRKIGDVFPKRKVECPFALP